MESAVMEYRYRIHRRDWLQWAAAIVGKTQGKGRILVLSAILGMLGVYLTKLGLERGAFLWADSVWSLSVFPIFLCLPWTVITVVIWCQSLRSYSGQELVLRLEEDRMVLEGAGHREALLESFLSCERAGSLLLLKYRGIGEEVNYSILPRRTFRDTEEEERFLGELERRVREAGSRNRQEGEDKVSRDPAQDDQDEASGSWSWGRYRYWLDEKGLAHMLAVCQAVQQKDRKGFRTGRILLAVCVCMLAAGGLYWLLSWPGLLLLLLLGLTTRLFIGRRVYNEQDFLEEIKAGKYASMLGEWEVDLSEDLIGARVRDRQYLISWAGLKEVLLVEDTYVFGYGGGRASQIRIPGSAFAGEREKQKFFEICAGKGLRLPGEGEIVRIAAQKKGNGARPRKFLRLAMTMAILWLAFQSVWPRGQENSKPLPLEEQYRILEELGFVVSEELAKEIGGWMEDEDYREYVETYPFYELLTELAMPEWDEETWKAVSFSDQAYWFDWEAWDVTECYEELLRGVESLSGGQLSFEQIVTDCSGADWEWGLGHVEVAFICNGEPCRMSLQVSGDWMDTSVIKKLNKVLAYLPGRKGDERIYACDDGGQGAILFYQDQAWARKFEKRTGIRLYFR